MTTEKYEVGNEVILKSGGPTMTVAKVNEDGSVLCGWFGSDQRQCSRSETFHAAMLRPKGPLDVPAGVTSIPLLRR